MATCVFDGCTNEARMHGNECRKCYLRVKKRISREKNPPEVEAYEIPVDPQKLQGISDAQQYDEWMNSQF